MNQELIKDYNFKKKFGQNFLKDENILKNIVDKSGVDKDTLVIEIGIGAAYLTYYLSEKAGNVLGYEIDESLKEIIEKQLETRDNVEIIYNDFLKTTPIEDIKKYNYKKIYVVANLPYYITTPIITKIIEEGLDIERMILMVQKEVGERFTSKIGTKDYSSITVYLNYYFDVKKEFIVSKNCFYPVPEVDSMIISLNKKERLELKNEELFFKLVKDSFQYKRKTLRNNLKGYDFNKILEILYENGFDDNVRAEEIPLEIYVLIANSL